MRDPVKPESGNEFGELVSGHATQGEKCLESKGDEDPEFFKGASEPTDPELKLDFDEWYAQEFYSEISEVNKARAERRAAVLETTPPVENDLSTSEVEETTASNSTDSLPEDVKSELTEKFKRLDRNGDGSITRTDIITTLRKHKDIAEFLDLPSRIKQEDGTMWKVIKWWHNVDIKDNGKITKDELEAYITALHKAGKFRTTEHGAAPAAGPEPPAKADSAMKTRQEEAGAATAIQRAVRAKLARDTVETLRVRREVAAEIAAASRSKSAAVAAMAAAADADMAANWEATPEGSPEESSLEELFSPRIISDDLDTPDASPSSSAAVAAEPEADAKATFEETTTANSADAKKLSAQDRYKARRRAQPSHHILKIYKLSNLVDRIVQLAVEDEKQYADSWWGSTRGREINLSQALNAKAKRL